MSLLDSIHGHGDVAALDARQRLTLCRELRETIFETVSVNGGHLASNFGVIELTVALHTVFDASIDRIVWDVGHQCYVHKILTGRKEEFPSIRQYEGLSGFPKHRESVCDAFDTGHSSTSISAALGLARARDLMEQAHSVIAVVGDGALTGGMCYEALCDAGHSESRMIVILNDNEMAISKSVGGMMTYLSKLRAKPRYLRFKSRLKRTLSVIPGVGKGLYRFAEKTRDRVKFFLLPRVFFEDLGFTYLGPFDGHDLDAMIEVLQDVEKIERPVFLHLITQKGKGYIPAEQDPEHYHSLGVHNNGCAKMMPSNGSILCKTLCELASEDERIVAITAAMTAGTGLPWFAQQYPKRFFDVGIAEQHAVTMAAGMARGGMRPFVALYSTFLQRAYDQIIHDVCLPNLPVVFCIDRAGLVGADGETHQGAFDISMLLPMPNMRVYSPCNQKDLLASLHQAYRADGPSAIRYPRSTLPLGEHTKNQIDHWRTVLPTSDISIIATGRIASTAQNAAKQLIARGVPVGLITACCLKPLDETALTRLASDSKHVITIEEGSTIGGFGAYVTQWAQKNAAFCVHSLGLPDRFIEHGKAEILLNSVGLNERTLVDLVLRIQGRQNG